MTTNHTELCERLRNGPTRVGYARRAADLIEQQVASIQQQAKQLAGYAEQHGRDSAGLRRLCAERDEAKTRIQQQALEYVSLQAQCDEHLARIAELEREKDEAEKHAAVVSSENFDLEARIAELDRKHKEAWDDCGELNTANHEPLAACGEKDRRIAELEKERDALKADAERWRFSGTMFFRMMSPDMGGNHGWVANGRGVGRGNTLNAAIDARIAALQAEKEKSRG